MDSNKYLKLLEDVLLKYCNQIVQSDWIYQQGNPAIHKSAYTKAWFQEHNITVLDWPACSPDLNPIENVWGELARKVYRNGRQFYSVAALKKRICKAWVEISLLFTQNLISLMPNRVFEVIQNQGSHTHY